MADVTNSIEGRGVILSISTNLVTPAYKEVVCSIDNGLSGTRDVNTQSTKCGVIKGKGQPNYTITGSLAANHTPESDEVSADELIALFDSGANFLFKLADATTPANYYRQGTGFFSDYNETANDGSNVEADFTIEVIGSLDITSES